MKSKDTFVYGTVEHICINNQSAYLRMVVTKVINRKSDNRSSRVEIIFSRDNFHQNRLELMSLATGNHIEVHVCRQNEAPNVVYTLTNKDIKKSCVNINDI